MQSELAKILAEAREQLKQAAQLPEAEDFLALAGEKGEQ